MDLSALIGILGGFALLYGAVLNANATAIFLNFRSFGMVLGGTLFSGLALGSAKELWRALRALGTLLRAPPHPPLEEMIGVMVGLTEQARIGGVRSILPRAGEVDDGGFLARALDVAVSSSDARLCRDTLISQINQIRQRHREVAGTWRTLGMLAPMFGLLGTLIGIAGVLSQISEPEALGPAMGTALSTAFYGILLSNLVFIPLAGKLRSRSLAELLAREVTMEAVLDIVYTTRMPALVEMRLKSFIEGAAAGNAGAAAPAPAGTPTTA
ncbi:MAG: MotA/TolQ/ExbB proton channel family protein [Elusimicrobia bacterium]|nr:MotA/TolQ/ExbB proton channel family protein [Elusimicrobiota bacterium]